MFGHFMVTDETKLVSRGLLFQTCPHVFKTPSTVFSVVYIYLDTLAHKKAFRFVGSPANPTRNVVGNRLPNPLK